MKRFCAKFTTAGFSCYCGDLKEHIHLVCCSDAQPCRMTHDGKDGTDVNRGRAQVGLTCTCPANSAACRRLVFDFGVFIGPPRRQYGKGARRSFTITPRKRREGGRKWLICQRRICVRDDTALTFARPKRSPPARAINAQQFREAGDARPWQVALV